MAEGKSSHEWGYWASFMALVANINRDQKRRPQPFTSMEFHPYLQAQAAAQKSQRSADLIGAMTSIAKRNRFTIARN